MKLVFDSGKVPGDNRIDKGNWSKNAERLKEQ